MLNVTQRKNSVLDEAIYQAAVEHRGCLPGVIQSIDTVGGNVTVRAAISEAVIDANGVKQDVPLMDIPMVKLAVLGAGGFHITLPVAAGDECLLLFQDMCLDAAWQNGGANNSQLDKRRHDLSDAICIPLTWTKPSLLSSYSTSSMQIRSTDGTTVIDIANGQITIKTGTQIQIVAPAVTANASGGTSKFLMNADLQTWIVGTLLTALAAHSITVTAPPASVVSTVLKGQ
jgi:hypothetical protein